MTTLPSKANITGDVTEGTCKTALDQLIDYLGDLSYLLDGSADGSVWTPGLTFGGASVGMTFNASFQHGVVVKTNGWIMASFLFVLTAKGSSTGSAVITGLPYTVGQVVGGTSVQFASTPLHVSNMASLSSPVMAAAIRATDTATLYDQSASDTTVLTEANFTDTTAMRGTLIYKV